MNDQDRQAIDGLFAKLDEAERRTGPRDAQAEGYIAQRIAQQPAAPYLMAQTIVMQDYALQQAQARIEELERQAQEAAAQNAPAPEPAPTGGLFGGLFGSSQPPVRRGPVPSVPRTGGAFGEAPMANPAIPAGTSPAWQSGAQSMGQPGYPQGQPGAFGQLAGRPGFGGGGFLAGAAQTAVGVAGGVLLGNALAGMFGGSEAKAAEAPAEAPAEPAHDDGNAADSSPDDASGGDDGSWFDGGGWFGGDDSI